VVVLVVAMGEGAEAAGAEVAGVDEEIAVVAAVIAPAGAAAGAVLAAEADVAVASDSPPLSVASHRHGSTLALVLLPVLLVPATHAGQNQSRRVT
jgi:hypothetical protein